MTWSWLWIVFVQADETWLQLISRKSRLRVPARIDSSLLSSGSVTCGYEKLCRMAGTASASGFNDSHKLGRQIGWCKIMRYVLVHMYYKCVEPRGAWQRDDLTTSRPICMHVCIVTCQRIARQRLDNLPVLCACIRGAAELCTPFLGNLCIYSDVIQQWIESTWHVFCTSSLNVCGDRKGRGGQSEAGGVSNRRPSLEFRSSKGTAMWPEEELEDLVCDFTCTVVHRYWECVI
jgi:hypothetical protein